MMLKCLLITLGFAQNPIVLDLVSPDTNSPRMLFVMGKGIRRSSANGDILETSDWIPLRLEDTFTWTEHTGLSEHDQSIILRVQEGDEIEIESDCAPRRYRQTSIQSGRVSVHPHSPLLRRYSHFIIRPIFSESSQPRLEMELAPANVEGHCSTPITYVDGIGSIGIDWMFNMVPRIVADESPVNAIALASIPMVIDFPANFPENFGFSPNLTFEHLPWNSVVGPLIAHVESRSDARRVGNSGNTENLRFADCTDYSIFPKILYSFYNRQEGIYRHRYHRKVDVILYPEDFVDIVTGSDGTSYCNLHIRISAETENYGTIGSNLIRAVPTHLDSANGVIGFCDPQ